MNILRKTSIALAALIFAAPCLAFPVVEGASVLGSLVGVICSVIVGLIPSTSKNIKFLSVLIGLLLCAAVYIGFTVKNEGMDVSINGFAHLSRPVAPSAAEATKRSTFPPMEYIYHETVFANENTEYLLSIDDFYTKNKTIGYKPVFLDYIEGGFNPKPESIAENISITDVDKIVSTSIKYDGKIVLFSSMDQNLNHAAYEIFRQTGKFVYKVQLPFFDFDESVTIESLLEDQSLWYQDYDNIFEQNLIDIRSSIEELNTIENAVNISYLDFYVMSDNEVKTLLNGTKNPIFIAYYPETYLKIHNRIKHLGVKYQFLKGGLDEFYERDYTTTPIYLNISRELIPYDVMVDYSQSPDLKFICIEEKHCMNNIPKEDTYYFSIRNDGREQVKSLVKSLPKEYRYITVSTNLETYGNSVLAGYWLNQSGHTYLGMFSHSDRFSLDFVHFELMSKRDILVSDYQSEFAMYQEAIQSAKSFTANFEHGWILLSVLVGIGFRLLLAPVQLCVSKSYYFKRSYAATGFCSLALLGALVYGYTVLNSLILDHGLVSHLEITDFNPMVKSLLVATFTAMIVFQLWISFPDSKRMRQSMIALIVVVYLAGLIGQIVTPLLLFLIGSEMVAISLQLPYLLKYRKQQIKGIYFTDHFNISDSLPEKWRLVNKFCDSVGFLASQEATKEGINKAISISLGSCNASNYLVRSCASDSKESLLGGYHDSIKVAREEIADTALRMLSDELNHVWIQPYYETTYNGVITSISDDVTGIHLVYGKGDAATEGGKGCNEVIIDRTMIETGYKPEVRLLSRVERFFKSAVQLEFGKTEQGKVILYQVRLLNQDKHESSKLYKTGISGVQLNESFLARSTRMTGSILENASSGDIMHVAGYNYLNLKSGYKTIYAFKWRYSNIEAELESYHSKVMVACSPVEIMNMIDTLSAFYRSIYKLTQSKYGFSQVESNIDFGKLGALNGQDLEICTQRSVILQTPYLGAPVTSERREAIHNLIVWVNYLMSFLLARYAELVQQKDYAHCTLPQIQAAGVNSEILILPYNANSLFEKQANQDDIIVAGEFTGTVFLADGASPYGFTLPGDGQWILAGEEIPSGWVKHLHLFSGIYSVYGHASSHLAISARELNIPYRKISKEQLATLR